MEKIFVEIGYVTVCVTKEEFELIEYLSKRNLLKFKPEQVEIYGVE